MPLAPSDHAIITGDNAGKRSSTWSRLFRESCGWPCFGAFCSAGAVRRSAQEKKRDHSLHGRQCIAARQVELSAFNRQTGASTLAHHAKDTGGRNSFGHVVVDGRSRRQDFNRFLTRPAGKKPDHHRSIVNTFAFLYGQPFGLSFEVDVRPSREMVRQPAPILSLNGVATRRSG